MYLGAAPKGGSQRQSLLRPGSLLSRRHRRTSLGFRANGCDFLRPRSGFGFRCFIKVMKVCSAFSIIFGLETEACRVAKDGQG